MGERGMVKMSRQLPRNSGCLTPPLSGLKGILGAMGACSDTRADAFRLFAADVFFTTKQVGDYLAHVWGWGTRNYSTVRVREFVKGEV